MEYLQANILKGWSDRLREAATAVISLENVRCFGSRRTLWEVVFSSKIQVPRLEIEKMNFKFKPLILAGIVRHSGCSREVVSLRLSAVLVKTRATSTFTFFTVFVFV